MNSIDFQLNPTNFWPHDDQIDLIKPKLAKIPVIFEQFPFKVSFRT